MTEATVTWDESEQQWAATFPGGEVLYHPELSGLEAALDEIENRAGRL